MNLRGYLKWVRPLQYAVSHLLNGQQRRKIMMKKTAIALTATVLIGGVATPTMAKAEESQITVALKKIFNIPTTKTIRPKKPDLES